MNAANCSLAKGLVSSTYIQQGEQALAVRTNLVKTLLSQRRLPEQGWDDAIIETFLQARRSISIDPVVWCIMHVVILAIA